MQVYPVLLLTFMYRLPESPRWCIFHEKDDDAHYALVEIYGKDAADEKLEDLKKAQEEESSHSVGYMDMISPWGNSFHPTMVTVMGQVNQALTGYGAVSVYGPQIFELLGFGVSKAEYLTQGNYVSYFFLMTFAWLLIDRVGRRSLMIWGSVSLSVSFLLLTLLGGLVQNADKYDIAVMPSAIIGSIILYIATGSFGIGWLSEIWLIPTEIYPSTARAQGAAVSVVVWGLANFAVTLVTPILFNNLSYWLFLIFAVTNVFAGWWTWVSYLHHPYCVSQLIICAQLYSPETGGRSLEENQKFFEDAKEQGTWYVTRVNGGDFRGMPKKERKEDGEDGETSPLLGRG